MKTAEQHLSDTQHIENVLGSETEPTDVIILIHGIRTQAAWAEMVSHVITTSMSAVVQPIRYGFFDVFRFLFPFYTRRKPVDKIIRELRDIRSLYPTSRVSVIAHSFGTYALFQALSEPDIRLHRIILCGSIVPDDFRRARFRAQISPDPILNDCGTADVMPVLARAITWGYGATGTFGFGTTGVRDRFNRFSHSDYFEESYVEKYWIPFLRTGEIVASPFERERRPPPYWQSLLAKLPLRWLLLVFLLSLCALPIYRKWVNWPRTEISIANQNITVTHFLGSPNVVVGTKLSFFRLFPINILLKGLRLTAPDGSSYLLAMEGAVLEDNAQPCMKISVAPVSKPFIQWQQGEYIWNISFARFTKEGLELSQTAVASMIDKGKGAKCRSEEAEAIVEPLLLEKLQGEAEKNWVWRQGSWRATLEYSIDDVNKTTEGRFTLTAENIKCLKELTQHYDRGIGVFGQWRFEIPQVACGIVMMTLEP